jgi:hypothetical protein
VRETHKNIWGSADTQYGFDEMVNTVLAIEDESALRDYIGRHPITMSNAFSSYLLDLQATWKQEYSAVVKAMKEGGRPSAAAKERLKKYQHDLKRLDVISSAATAVCFENYLKAHPPKPAAAPASRPDPAPSPEPPLAHDPRLTGQWEHSTYSSAPGFSYGSVRVRVLASNGRFVETGSSVATLTDHNPQGDETGLTAADSGVRADERGSWHTRGTVLRLDWDSGHYATFGFEISADGMLLTPLQPDGKATYWARK